MAAFAGEMTVPAPIVMDVNDADAEAVRADFQRRRRPRMWPFGLGLANVALGALNVGGLHREAGFWELGLGALWIVLAWIPPRGEPIVVRPIDVAFSNDGIAVTAAYSGKPARLYAWRWIRTIEDLGELFVIVPWLGSRVVLHKRAFPDGGREAWTFFAAHRVAGRVAPATPPHALA